MRSFACGHCGHLVFFENTRCLHCSTPLGFVADELEIVALEGERAERLHRCANAGLARCNWMVCSPGALCRSCALTRTRPGDHDLAGLAAFAAGEQAKRRVVMQLLELRLPGVEPGRLAFDLLSSNEVPVTTGHADGVITIDLAESDDASREARRQELGEPYRTMIGHLRHELGHYFQPLIVAGDEAWAACRERFGDERADYGEAMDRHYENGAPADWPERYVSAYATMHPWEDWAETFAHYLHIRDTLETAAEYGVTVSGPRAVAPDTSLRAAPSPDDDGAGTFAELLDDWLPLTYALNAVNRSMGLDDLYPFTLAQPVIDKLEFVHRRVRAAALVAG
ncbi:MAG TPA: putative zinc-binding metallopeptidase [Solirubrobacteraceae bacterium]|nr:putative zinc-binding metallopeptidase [Solirubrobacteraceae bacterium]